MEFEIPESLDGLDLDALPQLETDAMSALDSLRDDPRLESAGLARLRELAAFVKSVHTQQQRIEQAARQVASELSDLDGAVHGEAEPEDDGNAPVVPDGGGTAEGDEPSTAEEPEAEAGVSWAPQSYSPTIAGRPSTNR